MTSDEVLVKLREMASWDAWHRELLEAAAAEIERLRTELAVWKDAPDDH